MKINFLKKRIFFLYVLVLLIGTGCSGFKDFQERRNLMLPKKSDLPRNKKYKEPKKKKTYSVNKKRKKKRKKSKYY